MSSADEVVLVRIRQCMVVARCSAMVDAVRALAGPDEQNEPNPWVGYRAASGSGLGGQPADGGVLARA